MDVLLLTTSVFDLPSARRVGAIVYDGAADMRLWRGPGPDRELDEAWGGGLGKALDAERNKLGGPLSLGQAARVHGGRLHCDFLLWVATRAAEPGTERAPAPGVSALAEAVGHCLSFVAQRSVKRVAFPALGDGPGAAAPADRLAAIVRAANAYAERCFAEGRSAVIEEVFVCDPRAATVAAARRQVSGLVRAPSTRPAPMPASTKAAPKRRTVSRSRKKEPPKPALSTEEIGEARAKASPYDMTRTYVAGDRFIHPKFGVGRVFNVTQENAIEVVFEDRSIRKMVHARQK
jgi:O-acetyl-ADP-ribose deacetylase (regulator of RNase III)